MFPLCYLYRCAQTRGARLLANQPPQLSNFRLVYHQNSREDKGDPSPACWWASSLQPQLSGFPSSILQQGCGDAAQRIIPSRPPSAPRCPGGRLWKASDGSATPPAPNSLPPPAPAPALVPASTAGAAICSGLTSCRSASLLPPHQQLGELQSAATGISTGFSIYLFIIFFTLTGIEILSLKEEYRYSEYLSSSSLQFREGVPLTRFTSEI